MKFKQAIKRIVALGTGASMVGATIFGAMAADLSQYPSQYIKDGKFTGVLVVGDKAAAADVIGVTDIATSLQAAAVKPASSSSGGGTTLTPEGEAWKVGTSTKILELAENLETAAGNNRETIANITSSSFIDDGDLPNLLAAGTAANGKGDSPYEQRLYFETVNSGYVQFLEDRDDVTADFLYFPNNIVIARYELEFTTALESDVDDSAGTATTTGLYLTDIENTDVTMMGKTYSIVQARRTAAVGGNIKLIMMGGAAHDTLNEGSTKTYTVGGKDYEVTLTFVDANSAKFTINGETTRDLLDGETDKLSDGTVIGVSEILYQDYAGGVHNAEFFLGAQKVELKDTNIRDINSTSDVKIDDETIDGAAVFIEGTDDNTTFKIDKITVNMTADDDYYVPAGGKLSENSQLNEPELLFTKNWDIEYKGLSDEPVQDINIKSSGSDDYELEFVDGNGNVAKIPIAHSPTGTTLRFGDNDNDLIVAEGKTIQRDDYFVVTDYSDSDGERQSFALRYKGADKSSAENPVVKFEDLGTRDTVERPITVGSIVHGDFGKPAVTDVAKMAELKLGGATFNIYNATSHLVNDFDIVVDMNGIGGLASDNNSAIVVVGLNSKWGANISVQNNTNASTDDGIIVRVTTPNVDDFDDVRPNFLGFNITATAGEVRLGLETDQLHSFRTPEDDDKNQYAYTSYGAYARRSIPTSDPQEIYIQYPQHQRVPQVFVTGKGASFTSTAVASGSAVTVQRIDVGAAKLVSEVPNIKAVNSILVGGPCANAAAAEVMGTGADCTAGFEPGVGIIQVWDVGSNNVAMLVAGYAADDTRNAAAVVANYGDHKGKLTGGKVEVTKVNNVLTVAKPSEKAMVKEEAAEEETPAAE